MAQERWVGALALASVGILAGWSEPALGQGFQDALGPSAESRALAGAMSASARGASASFINPAGLGRAERPEVYAGFGLLGTNRSSVPEGTAGPIDSELELTPLPALSVGVPLTPWLVLGGHAAPASFQGGAFQVDVNGTSVRDARSFRIMEAGPEVAVLVPEELVPGALSVGVGYRVTAGGLDRIRAPSVGAGDVRLDLAGVDATGMRLGLQYSPIPEFRLGVTWQTGVSLRLGGDSGQLAAVAVDQPSAVWTLPTRVTIGGRFDIDRYGLALEYRLADYSGTELTYRGTASDGGVTQRETVPLGAVHSAHLGGEVRLSREELEFPLRAGVAIESIFGSQSGAAPFELPPAPLTTLSVGAGVQHRDWGGSLAVSTRLGGGTVFGTGSGSDCDLCGQPGQMMLYEWALALDFAVRLGR